MADWRLRFYHQMPWVVRNLAASARGAILQRLRYGHETEALVQAALEREYWSLEQWKLYQEERLSIILHRAATLVPFYRDQWSQRRRQGDSASWEYLENWQILEKNDVRRTPRAFVAEDHDVRSMVHDHTSGTTGTPVHIYQTYEMVRAWYALFEARWRRWYGVSLESRWAILGGQLVCPIQQKKPPFWVWNAPMQQLYMSSYHIAPNTVRAYLDALRTYRVEYIYCYTSSGYCLADELLRQNLEVPDIKVVVTNAEPVYDYQRERMETAFRCPVRETYGQTEVIVGASECQHRKLHLWPEVGVYEVLEEDAAVAPESSGDLVSTTLMNEGMPLIRYRLGDRVAMASPHKRCDCGRTLPMLLHVEGRSDDVLYTTDGRRIGRLDPVFKSDLAIREAQIVQDSLSQITVKVVWGDGYSDKTIHAIREQIQARMGMIDIRFEELTEIPRTKNGKFRAVVCNLSQEERERVSRR
jgi:phenylacetate-CoA ligase